MDNQMTETMKDSLMYRLSYHRFGELKTTRGKPTGFDKMRNCEIGHKEIHLKHFRESFSSKSWIVRIYEVLPEPNREKAMQSRFFQKIEKVKLIPKLAEI